MVLQNIEITKITLPKIIERIRDEKEDVRLLAFSLLQKVPMKKLLIAQRVNIIKNGLLDRDEKAQESCFKLCQIWLSQVDSNVIKFLECLDVELYKDTCDILLEKIFETEKFVHIDHENLTPETIFYWRKKCEFLQKKNNEEALDENLISISQFCDLLIKYQTTNVNEFVVKELLELSKYLDYCDEVGRKTMNALLGQMLIAFTLPELYVKEIIHSLIYVVPNPDDLTSTIIHAIDELRKAGDINSKDQLTDEEKKEIEKKIKSIQKQIKSLEKKKKEYVDEEEYEMAKKTKSEIEELESQLELHQEELKLIDTEAVSMWMRALIIVYEFLKITRINISHMLFLKDDLVLKNIKNENAEVQGASFSVLSQFSSLKKDIAQSSIDIFTKCLSESQTTIIHLNALKGLFDIVLIHGFDSFESSEIFESLERFLKSEDQDLRTLATEGFCKLLMCKKLSKDKRPKVISQLIILLHSPSTENDLKLRQCLTSFFPSYAFSYLDNLQSIADSFVPTLRRIEQSKEKINSLYVCQFLIVHTDISSLKEKTDKDLYIHDDLALALSFELLTFPKNHQYCKLLNSFTIKKEIQIQKILTVIPKIKKLITNKTSLKSLEKFESNNKGNKENLKDIVDKEFEEHEKKYGESTVEMKSTKPQTKKTQTKKMRQKKKEKEEESEEEVIRESPVKPKKKKKKDQDEGSIEKLKKDIHKIVEKIK